MSPRPGPARASRPRHLRRGRRHARLRPRVVRENARVVETVEFEPVGIVAHVSAWNYPHLLAANVLAPALAVGAVALHKPSETTPSVGARVERLLRDAGVTDGVFQTCQGGPAVGRALASLRGVGALAFTGSRRSGRDAAPRRRRRTPRTVLELGGNDAAYVREDIENVVDAARSIADGAFLNAGQGCCAVERVYCHTAVADAFVDAFLERASTFVAGDPTDSRTTLGPMAKADGPRRVAAHVAEAVETGAKILYEGAHPADANGSFHPVTVIGGDALRGSQRARALTRDETFGPVVALVVVDDDEEAVEAMADTSFGLTASVYTSNAEVGTNILRRLNVGTDASVQRDGRRLPGRSLGRWRDARTRCRNVRQTQACTRDGDDVDENTRNERLGAMQTSRDGEDVAARAPRRARENARR